MAEQATLFPHAAPDIQRSADISPDGQYRWRLERRWGPGPAVCWIMLNPSTADAEIDDPTIRRVIAFSKRWGRDAAVVVNVWPFRSSSPLDCRDWAGAMLHSVRERRVFPEAQMANTKMVWREASRGRLVIAAWGSTGWGNDVKDDLVKSLHLQNIELHCLGTNADGSPKHPLARGRNRVPDDQEPVRYDRARD